MRKFFQRLLRSAWKPAGLAIATVFLQMSFASAQAEDELSGNPSGRVARLNHIDGPVSFSAAGTDDWTNANPNRPLTAGDRIWADKGARSELHVGATSMRLSGNTSLEILDLSDQDMQLKVTQGTFSIRVRDLDRDDTVEIDTPNIAFVVREPGEYRFDVDPDRDTTTVTVRRGSGVAYGSDDKRSVPMKENRLLTFSGDDLFYSVSESAPPRDAFERWAAQRDEREDQARSVRYVSRDMTGYEDLDDNGEWRETRDYGPVWVPRVTVRNWAPYHYGHWAWIAPWGWTWVDDERWGFAPFHYGRWAHIDDRWAWVPGPLVRRPVYAPALVGFVGGDRSGGTRWGVSISVGLPGIAWFALAPGEHYRPAYTNNPRYISNVNRTVVVHKTVAHNDIYINQRMPHAIAAMPARDFVNGRPAHEHRGNIREDRLKEFARTPAAASLPVAPVRQSITGNSPRAQNAPPARFDSQKVVARRTAPEAPVFHDKLARKFANEQGEVRGAGPAFTPAARPVRADATPSARESRDGNQDRRLDERARPNAAVGRDAPGNAPSAADRPERRDEKREERKEERKADRREDRGNDRSDRSREEARPEAPRPPQRIAEPVAPTPPSSANRQRSAEPIDATPDKAREVARPPVIEPRRDAVRFGRSRDEDRAAPADKPGEEERRREERQRPERAAQGAAQTPVQAPPVQQAAPAPMRVEAPVERRPEPRQDATRQEPRQEVRQERREERREEARPQQPRPEARPELRPEPRQERPREARENRQPEERRTETPRDDDRRQRGQDGERRQHKN